MKWFLRSFGLIAFGLVTVISLRMLLQYNQVEFLPLFFGQSTLILSYLVPVLIRTKDEWRFENTSNSTGNCSYFSSIDDQKLSELGRGFNKIVYKSFPQNVAIKKVSFSGNAFVKCMDDADSSFHAEYECIQLAAKSFITEIGLMLTLQGDPNVPTLMAYCIPLDFVADAEQLSSATSVGAPLDVIHLAQSEWEERVRIIDEILRFLDRTKPLAFHDLRRQQFVLIENRPVMVDFDDVSYIPFQEGSGYEYSGQGMNPVIRRLYTSFIDGFLFQSHPPEAAEKLKDLKESYEDSTLTLGKLKNISRELRELSSGMRG